MSATSVLANRHSYKGWVFHQVMRGQWALTRVADSYTTHHNSYGGCKSFIRLHGNAANPDASYESSIN